MLGGGRHSTLALSGAWGTTGGGRGNSVAHEGKETVHSGAEGRRATNSLMGGREVKEGRARRRGKKAVTGFCLFVAQCNYFARAREHELGRGREREGEKIPSRLGTVIGAQCGASSHNREIMT